MDDRDFIKFMKKSKRSDRAVARYLKFLETVKEYLMEVKGEKSLEEITPDDVRDFALWGDKELKGVTQHLWAIKVYAEYLSRDELDMTANELIGERYASQFKLKDFDGFRPEDINRLASMEIKTAAQMTVAGGTKERREQLSKDLNIPIETITELVKLSDLARIPGLKNIRARLYYEAGLDTIDEIAKWDPEEMRGMLGEFIKRTGFDGTVPLPKEAATTVAVAKHIPRIVEY